MDALAPQDHTALEDAAKRFAFAAFWMDEATFTDRLKMMKGALFTITTRHGHSPEAALSYGFIYATTAQAQRRMLTAHASTQATV